MERIQSSGARAVQSVFRVLNEVLMSVRQTSVLSLHQLVRSHSFDLGVLALLHDRANTHAVERTPNKENRDEKEYRSQDVSDSGAIFAAICDRDGQFHGQQSKERSELDPQDSWLLKRCP